GDEGVEVVVSGERERGEERRTGRGEGLEDVVGRRVDWVVMVGVEGDGDVVWGEIGEGEGSDGGWGGWGSHGSYSPWMRVIVVRMCSTSGSR
ncbi:hypothetical protein, partial [Corynebacterium glyciniphilum]|uniref:hypothetical protein n=1 Tax=Corynebacterium glyciniphilum TaxID=1404244 RepID=UPI001C92F2C7